MLSESHPRVRMLLRFAMLPACFATTIDWEECARSRPRVAWDLLRIFFRFRYYPDNYGPCRLWEKPPGEWVYYFGSSYHPWARHHLRKTVQPFDRLELFLDKAKCDEHFRHAGIPMPRTLGVLAPGSPPAEELARLLDWNADHPLIIKPVRGARGRDVYIVERRNGGLVLRSGRAVIPAGEFRVTESYLVQDFVEQHPGVAEIFPHSVNTVRVVVLLTASGAPLILGSYMRLGRGASIVDNVNQGGLAVPIDVESGAMGPQGYNGKGRTFPRHPDTHVAFAGRQVPCWDAIVAVSHRAQMAVPFYKLIGLDVAVTAAGPVIIEVNANPDIIALEQRCGPLLRNPQVLHEFARHHLLFNRHQRRLAQALARTSPPDPITSR